MSKSKLRSKILNLRKKNSFKNIKLNPERILRFLKKNKIKFKNLGGYYPCYHEIDDLEILKYLRTKSANISLPVIRKNNQMDFFEWTNKEPLKINKFGIAEPISAKKIYPDVIFVPLVGYDKNLNRLGYGGGFYDRYIEKIKKIIKIGLAFSYQELKVVPVSVLDKKLDFVITEKEIIQ